MHEVFPGWVGWFLVPDNGPQRTQKKHESRPESREIKLKTRLHETNFELIIQSKACNDKMTG